MIPGCYAVNREWFGGKDHPRWASLLEKVPKQGNPYLEKWLDDHEWMSKVPEFNNDNPVWHFYPVELLSIVGSKISITIERGFLITLVHSGMMVSIL